MIVGTLEFQHTQYAHERLALATRQARSAPARARQTGRDSIGVVPIEAARQEFGGDLERVTTQRDLERLEIVGSAAPQECFDFLLDLRRDFAAEPFFSSTEEELGTLD